MQQHYYNILTAVENNEDISAFYQFRRSLKL